MLKGKRIILGVTGSIAAYKAATLIRGLVKEGAKVKVVMTPLAKEFITPLTLATLSKNPILVEFFDPENGQWNSHVSLGEWADAYLIAPATANTLAKMANGVADNLLLTTYLSAKCPVFAAPAMDLDMYRHAATQRNLECVKKDGVMIVEPESGELASGLVGKGRMAEPDTIVEYMKKYFVNGTMTGKRVMISAGGTIEAIDPVRYISNHSTGKMGYAIAEEFALRGADVTIIKGNVRVTTSNPAIKIVEALSAQQMYDACTEHFANCDIAVMSAAVADYTPKIVESVKVKKNSDTWELALTKTKDIASVLGAQKGKRILVGFALETNDEENNARDKMSRKNLDMIVLNSLRDQGAGFGYNTNKVSIIDCSGAKKEFPLKEKSEVARDIVDTIESLCYAKLP